MDSFTCPFCGQMMSIHNGTYKSYWLNFSREIHSTVYIEDNPYLEVEIIKCPNGACGKETCIAHGRNDYIENTSTYIYPKAIYKHFPDYVPNAIRDDYIEACIIQNDSPKAAATLARRCLQGMIYDLFPNEIKGLRNLSKQIEAIKGKIAPLQWDAIDGIRSIGNIGAHMEKNVNLIIPIESDEADKLIWLIEFLIDEWYVKRHAVDERLKDIVQMKEQKEALRESEIDPANNSKEKKRIIKYYDARISAGLGTFTPDDAPYEEIYTSNKKGDFAVSISGESMMPNIPDKSIVLVQKKDLPRKSKIGIFNYKDESYCKIYIKDGETRKLKSINQTYGDMIIEPNESFEFIGEVVGCFNADQIQYVNNFVEAP